MDHDRTDVLMQVIGLCAAILPMVGLAIWLGIASRRRQAAERAEFAEPTPET
jgi:hypothetical protein